MAAVKFELSSHVVESVNVEFYLLYEYFMISFMIQDKHLTTDCTNYVLSSIKNSGNADLTNLFAVKRNLSQEESLLISAWT